MTMIALSIPSDITKKLVKLPMPKGSKIKQEDMHITLFHFKENLKVDQIAYIFEVLYNEISELNPFKLSLTHISAFPKGEDGYPIILRITSQALQDFRENVAKKLDKKKIPYSNNFGFNPHITLVYSEEDFKKTKIDKITFTPDTLFLEDNRGSNYEEKIVVISFPLDGKISKADLLFNLSEGFAKLS